MPTCRFRPSPAVLVLAVLGLLGVFSCGGAAVAGEGQGLLVIAIDALRRDHLQVYGSDRATSPFLQRLAADSVVFEDAWSTGAALEASHVALLTGCDPLVAISPRVPLKNGDSVEPALPWRVPAEVPHLPLEFLAEGWATGGFVDHPGLSEVSGFGLGFHDFLVSRKSSSTRGSGVENVAPRLLRWLDDLEDQRNWFGYMHLGDLELLWSKGVDNLPMDFPPRPELDYLVPQGNSSPVFHALPRGMRSEFRRSLGDYESIYDTAIARLDGALEQLFEELDARGVLDKTTVVLVGTYGFGFGEAGLLVDAGTLSEVDLRVPLMIRPAPYLGLPTGRREGALVSLLDLPPTLLGLASIREPDGMHGNSLGGLLAGSDEKVRDFAFALGGIHTGFAAVDEEYLYTHSLPGQGKGRLQESWFGERTPKEVLVEGLFVRGERLRPGKRAAGIGNLPRSDRLRAAGEAWYTDLGRVRDALHLARWLPSVRDPRVLDELRAKGLLGEL